MELPVNRTPRVPKTVVWELTAACNLRCIHCEGSAGKKDPEELTPEESLALCDELARMGCERCNLSGGEPLMRRDWPLLAARLAGHGMDVHLVTNGHLLDDAAVAKAVEAGVTGVAVSLDGLQATHDRIRVGPKGPCGSFDQVLAEVLNVVDPSPDGRIIGMSVVLAKGRCVAQGTVAEMRAIVVRKRIDCTSALPLSDIEAWPEVTAATRVPGSDFRGL